MQLILRHRRIADLQRFYSILASLGEKDRGARTLANCSGHMRWPKRGVYFFMETGERRSDTGSGPRIVRVGTHALKAGARTTIWTRLSQHRGPQKTGGGNHRGSIFRLIVGSAIIAQQSYEYPTWGKGNTVSAKIRAGEQNLEREVSQIIGAMPFLWLAIEDEPGPQSLRGEIERNAIALLSNFDKEPLDPPSTRWLGHYCDRERVQRSGLWNSNHVDERYNPAFLATLERLVIEMEPVR